MTKKQVGEERVYSAYTSISLLIIEGSQDRNSNRAGSWRQELMQRPWKDAAYWIVPYACSVCFLAVLRATSPRTAPPTMSWACPYQSLIKKMPYRLAYSPIL